MARAAALDAPEEGNREDGASGDGSGKLIAAPTRNLITMDLRNLIAPDDIRAAERIAMRLGAALRDRRSRRRKVARTGRGLDFHRTLPRSLTTGGEPLDLALRRRPDHPVKLALLVDVSGSMAV
jgi:uncharacterized protein with von Willebrand factor type A (vWA) domain